jgi:hypothetical protein
VDAGSVAALTGRVVVVASEKGFARDAVSECKDLLLPDELPKIVRIWLTGNQIARARRGGHLSGAPARLGTGSLPDSIQLHCLALIVKETFLPRTCNLPELHHKNECDTRAFWFNPPMDNVYAGAPSSKHLLPSHSYPRTAPDRAMALHPPSCTCASCPCPHFAFNSRSMSSTLTT